MNYTHRDGITGALAALVVAAPSNAQSAAPFTQLAGKKLLTNTTRTTAFSSSLKSANTSSKFFAHTRQTNENDYRCTGGILSCSFGRIDSFRGQRSTNGSKE